MTASQHTILQLEHELLYPLGEHPDHCSRCAHVHDCGHEVVERDDIYAWGDRVAIRSYTVCAQCGIRWGER